MARIKNQEIIRRTDVPSRQSSQPSLTVQADLDSSRGYNALTAAATDTLGRLASVYTEGKIVKREKQNKEDETAGASARTEEDLRGAARQDEAAIRQQTDAWRRGYMKTDALLKVRSWAEDATKEMMQAEPGTNVDEVLQRRAADLLALPEFQDPKVREALLPAVQRASEGVRAKWLEVETAEIVERQTESATALVRAMVTEGGIKSPEDLAKIDTQLADNPDLGYLNNRERDEVISRAFMDVLASGDADPDEVQALLSAKRPDGSPGLWDSKWQDQFEAHAVTGANIRAKRENEARNVKLAQMEFTLQQRADSGSLAESELVATLAKAGITPESDPAQYTSTVRYFIGQRDAARARQEAEAKAAARHAETMRAMRNGNPYEVGPAKAAKAAEREWANTPQEQRGLLIAKYARMGVPIPQVKAVFSQMTSATLPQASLLYKQLRDIDPLYAAKHVGDGNAAMLYQHYENTHRLNMTEQDSLRVLSVGAPPKKRSEVSPLVAKAGRAFLKENKTLPDGTTRPHDFLVLTHNLAVADMMANPQVSPEVAYKAAEEMARTRYVNVGGAFVPRAGMMDGAERATEALLEKVRDAAVKRGTISANERDDIAAAPAADGSGRWVITRNGYPFIDPDSGRQAVFDPNATASAFQQFEAKRAGTKVRREANLRSAFGGSTTVTELGETRGRSTTRTRDWDAEVRTLRSNIAADEQTVRTTGTTSAARKAAEARLLEAKPRLQKLTDGVEDVPDDFLDYLSQQGK